MIRCGARRGDTGRLGRGRRRERLGTDAGRAVRADLVSDLAVVDLAAPNDARNRRRVRDRHAVVPARPAKKNTIKKRRKKNSQRVCGCQIRRGHSRLVHDPAPAAALQVRAEVHALKAVLQQLLQLARLGAGRGDDGAHGQRGGAQRARDGVEGDLRSVGALQEALGRRRRGGGGALGGLGVRGAVGGRALGGLGRALGGLRVRGALGGLRVGRAGLDGLWGQGG